MYLKINDFLYEGMIVFMAVLAAGTVLWPEPLMAQSKGGERKLNIVTSYPRDLTDIFRREFVAQYPDVEVNISKKKTGAAIEYLDSARDENTTDLFWASSPDAFEMLKSKDLLQAFDPEVQGIPKMALGSLLNDAENYYSGFALSGYGFMWNTFYLQAQQLPEPANWEDLANPAFHGHVGMSSPSRSGTTHITLESLLQTLGWEAGWKLARRIGANLKRVTKKSYDVPLGVRDGEFGVGIVIDFYGFSAQAQNYPVKFAYPDPPTLLPANIGLIRNAPNSETARDFIRFLLSADGQFLLLNKNISRLPVRPEIYDSAPDGYPNPYKDKGLKGNRPMDIQLSKQRYHLVNALFDNMVTFNLEGLQKAMSAVSRLEARLQHQHSLPQSVELLQQAKELLFWLPVDEAGSGDEALTGVFIKSRKDLSDMLQGEQREIEKAWDEQIKENYRRAKALAEEGLALVPGRCGFSVGGYGSDCPEQVLVGGLD